MTSWNVGARIPSDLSQLLGSEHPLIVVGIQEVGSNPTPMTTIERSLNRNQRATIAHPGKLIKTKEKPERPWVKLLPFRRKDPHTSRNGIVESTAQLCYYGNQKRMEQAVMSSLPSAYRILCSKWMWQTGLIIVINEETMAGRISDVKTGHKATGIAGVCGDKGAVWAKMRIDGMTKLCFINTHLAAHEGEQYLSQRNAQVKRIVLGIKRRDSGVRMQDMYDHVFWCGDLNYRLDTRKFPEDSSDVDGSNAEYSGDAAVTEEKLLSPRKRKCISVKSRSQYVKALFCFHSGPAGAIVRERIEQLRGMDELGVEMKRGGVFEGFREGDISFAPTFKVHRHTASSDSEAGVDEHGWLRGDEYQSQRTPAYCDRILWRSKEECAQHVRQLAYGSLTNYCSSDHKPVYATFQVATHPPTPRPELVDSSADQLQRRLANRRLLQGELNGGGVLVAANHEACSMEVHCIGTGNSSRGE